MLDIGWNELLIVALVTILVVGPKELPHVLRTVTQFVRKLRSMASEFQSGLDDLAREAELEEFKQSVEKTVSTDLAGELEAEIDPTGDIDRSVREIEEQIKEDPRRSSRSGGETKKSAAKSKSKKSAKAKKAQPAKPAEPSIAPPHSLAEDEARADAAAADPPAAGKLAGKGS